MKSCLPFALMGISILCAASAARAGEPLPPIQKVEIGEQGEFRVNGRPFIPIQAWLQTPRNFPLLKELGFNTMAGYHWNKTRATPEEAGKGILDYAEQAHKAGLYYISPYEHELLDSMKVLAKTDYLFGWIHNDEPDMPRKVDPKLARDVPAGVKNVPRESAGAAIEKYKRIREIDPGRFVKVGFTASFMSTDAKYTPEQKKAIYPEFLKACDAVGYDTYPIFGSAWPGRLNDVGLGVRELRALAGPKRGLSCAIETNKGSKWVSPGRQLDVLPKHTRFEVWSALISGATGINYFTHSWVAPDGNKNFYTTFAPNKEMQGELKRLNAQITRLTPAIVGPPAKAEDGVQVKIEGGLSCLFKATDVQGVLYVFAVNTDLGKDREAFKQFEPIAPRSAKATVSCARLKAGMKVEVVDEGRTITAEDGRFTDEFGPLTEHVYRIAGLK